MPIRTISAADDHLARMVGSKPINGVAELVWNSFDANATEVRVDIKRTVLGAVDEVVVVDNGHGFSSNEVEQLFDHVGGSWKHRVGNRKTRDGKRILHGDKGEGRWKAFAVGDRVVWRSVTEAEGKPNERVRLVMSRERLHEYSWTGPEDSTEPPGTTVTVVTGARQPEALLTAQSRATLTSSLALYLTQYPDVEVLYDGAPLNVSNLIARSDTLAVEFENPYGPLTVTVLEWHGDVERALFLCDEVGATLHTSKARIHAPGFVFTAYVQWAGFRVHESLLALEDLANDDITPAVDAARAAIRDHFARRRLDTTKSVVQEWREEHVYPYAEDPEDAMGQAEQALFNYVAVTAAEAVNRIDDQQAKALSLSAIRVAVEQDPSSIEVIFREVLKLPDEKIDEFRQLLERTSLSALVDAMRLVTGRLEFLAGLEMLLFDPRNAPEVLERAHLHKIIEDAPWLFGEEFATHVSDRGLTALLEAHLALLGRDHALSEPVTDDDGKSRRIDFLFGRVLESNRNSREHLVVEIKRPDLTVGRDEIAQIEDYAAAVVGDSRFDLERVDWDFVLVATGLDDHATRRGEMRGKPRGLIQDTDDGVRVWVRRWSEVIADCKHRLQFIRTKLEYDPDGDEALAFLRDRYPDYLPEHLQAAVVPPDSEADGSGEQQVAIQGDDQAVAEVPPQPE